MRICSPAQSVQREAPVVERQCSGGSNHKSCLGAVAGGYNQLYGLLEAVPRLDDEPTLGIDGVTPANSQTGGGLSSCILLTRNYWS